MGANNNPHDADQLAPDRPSEVALLRILRGETKALVQPEDDLVGGAIAWDGNKPQLALWRRDRPIGRRGYMTIKITADRYWIIEWVNSRQGLERVPRSLAPMRFREARDTTVATLGGAMTFAVPPARPQRRPIGPRLRYDVLRADAFRCVLCGMSAANGTTLHVDHIVPVSKGGTNDRDNLRALCAECNVGRGARE